MTLETYTIGTESNSYFMGRDAVLYKNGERVATVALKDNRPAIKVKVHDWGTGDPEVRRMEEDLGEDRVERVCEQIQESFWYYSAPECVRENGHYDDVWSAGRSAGWCVPVSRRDSEWQWWDEGGPIDAAFPEVESVDELSSSDMRRYWFFQAAEAITAEVEYLRTEDYDELIRDTHHALEQQREALAVRGDN